MSDEKLFSEAEVRQRERAAFVDGALCYGMGNGGSQREVERSATDTARRRYPITRRVPRVVKVVRDGVEWEVKRCNDGFYARSHPSADWTLQSASCTPDNVRALVDLLDNPYEEVTE
jgi:hypothetical protein